MDKRLNDEFDRFFDRELKLNRRDYTRMNLWYSSLNRVVYKPYKNDDFTTDFAVSGRDIQYIEPPRFKTMVPFKK
jgi:hypothetical protein